jgi:pimeloyl-ACP methyl ester carboxylesterase/GNAT superfamily N-acetyltransferase
VRSSDIRIREAKPKDYARVAAMHYPVWRQSWKGIVATHVLDMISTPKTWADTFYPTTLKRGGWQMWLAESRGQLLGMTLFGPDLSDPKHIQIDALYILDQKQRHGIGSMLLNKVLRTYPDNDIILWCADKNQKARNFYEKNGFALDDRTYVWKPLPGVTVPHMGYRLSRSETEAAAPPVQTPVGTPAASIQPYPIDVPQTQLDDLRHRLSTARWPAEISGADWDYGTEQAFLRNVVDHWLHRYDWRATEAEVNAAGSFVTQAAGQRVHFLHAKAERDDAIPLAITHGWPGSIAEFLDALPLLRKRFHVVLISMPGYGFSGPTRERGVDVAKVAAAVADVMAQLGYDRYLAQGGDWGALVTRHLGEHYPQHAVAIHTNMLFAPPDQNDQALLADVTEQEWAAVAAGVERIKDGTAYMEIQSTRPHSLGYGLDDSPLGLAGWILEKFHAWCDISDGIPISTGRLIDNLMFYWLTGTATSAARLYCESARAGTGPLSDWPGRVDVPTGYAVYPGEMLQTPRAWAAARYNLVHYAVHDRGGHFAAFEQPQLFAADLTQYADVLVEKGVF